MQCLDVAVAVILRGERCFLQRRAALAESFPGRWEFPGGKLEPGEMAEAALRRELQEELRWIPDLVEALASLEFSYPDRQVRLHPFRCGGPGLLHSPLAWGWFRLGEARRLSVPEATRALLDRLRA